MKVSRGTVLGAGALLLALVLVPACSSLEDSHGYVPEAGLVAEVQVGIDTKVTVARILGRPGVEGIIDDSGWYYVRSDYERRLWYAPVELNREVLAVSFADDGVVENVERFGLEDGRVVALERRVTDSNTQGISFLRQLFSNFGNFDASALFDEN
ncbi:MAG: outer membrane protein assembly factor BamE [Boseongicola sp. SB0662_bin_57]|nr:outer membrane protein assembly factor BamE [Boseongicola sp. SB0662_bin_57]